MIFRNPSTSIKKSNSISRDELEKLYGLILMNSLKKIKKKYLFVVKIKS